MIDINVNVTLTAPALTDALLALVSAKAPATPPPAAVQPVTAHIPPAPTPTTSAPVPAPMPPATPFQAPVAAVPMYTPPAVPVTAAPAYTMDTLANAAAELVRSGKQQELVALLGQFGVPAMTQLKQEQYGAFATALRQMGGKI